jgi:hypothetical protein
MTQPPATDENYPVGAPASHRAPPARRSRQPVLIVAAAVVLAAEAVAAGVLLSEPSYPHSWCGPVLAELHASGGTEGDYEATMTRLQSQDHAPVGKLLADLYQYDQAKDTEESANNFAVLGAAGNAMSALETVSGDLRVIGRECGQPKGAYAHYTF